VRKAKAVREQHLAFFSSLFAKARIWANRAAIFMEIGRKVGRVTPCAPFARRRLGNGARGVARPISLPLPLMATAALG